MMTIYIDKDALLHKMQERHGELASIVYKCGKIIRIDIKNIFTEE